MEMLLQYSICIMYKLYYTIYITFKILYWCLPFVTVLPSVSSKLSSKRGITLHPFYSHSTEVRTTTRLFMNLKIIVLFLSP